MRLLTAGDIGPNRYHSRAMGSSVDLPESGMKSSLCRQGDQDVDVMRRCDEPALVFNPFFRAGIIRECIPRLRKSVEAAVTVDVPRISSSKTAPDSRLRPRTWRLHSLGRPRTWQASRSCRSVFSGQAGSKDSAQASAFLVLSWIGQTSADEVSS